MKNNSESYAVWNNKDFWIYWVKREIYEKCSNRKVDEGFYFEILIDVTNIMFKLNLNDEFISNTIVGEISKKYFTEVSYNHFNFAPYRRKL